MNMYNIFIVRGFAHRLMKNGLMESAPVRGSLDSLSIDEKSFQQRPPSAMNLSGGDYAQIESDLNRYSHMMPADYVLPSSITIEQESVQASEIPA